jgi:hypothetical protein
MYNPTSLAVRSATHFSKLVESVVTRLHRKFDARFQLLDEAFAATEKRDPTLYPSVRKILLSQNGGSVTVVDKSYSLGVTVTGTNFSADESELAVTLAGTALTISAGASATSFVATLSQALVNSSVADKEIAMLQVRVRGVLCASFPLISQN